MTELEFLSLLELIYDAAVLPSKWHAALDAVRIQLGFFNVIMTLFEMPASRLLVGARVNVPDDMFKIATNPEYLPHLMSLWGGMAAVQKHVVEEPVVISRVRNMEDYADNPYYLDFAKPQDLVDVVSIPLLRDRQLLCDLSMGRHSSAGVVSDAVIADMKRLAPHLRRAASLSGILSLADEAIDTFESAIDATPAAVLLLDEQLAIVHANSAAGELLDRNDVLGVGGDGKLVLRQPFMPNALQEAVHAAARNPLAMGRKGISIPARRLDGAPVALHVFPLLRRKAAPDRRGRAIAALFVTESGSGQARTDFLGTMFELTPAEVRVLELASAGLSNPNIAVQLGVATSTVKTHLNRIFEKTGRHTRAELIRLTSDLQPPA